MSQLYMLTFKTVTFTNLNYTYIESCDLDLKIIYA